MNMTLSTRWWMVFGLLFATLLAVSLMGCAAPPDTEMAAARTALDGAKSAQAATYAEQDWSQAQSTMTAAEAELETQGKKFALFRSYDQARNLITTATEKAEEARTAAVAGKEKARTEAQTAHDVAQAAVEKARNLIAEIEGCGRSAKGMVADLASLRGGTDALSGELSTVSAALTDENFSEAQERGRSIEEQAEKMATDLQGAMTKLGCRPKA